MFLDKDTLTDRQRCCIGCYAALFSDEEIQRSVRVVSVMDYAQVMASSLRPVYLLGIFTAPCE